MVKQEIYSQPKKEIIIRVKKKKPKKSTYFLIAASAIILFYLFTSAEKQLIEVKTVAEEKYYTQVPVSEMKEFNVAEVYYERAAYTGFSPCRYEPYNFTENVTWSYEVINGTQYFVCDLTVFNHESKAGEWEYFALIESRTSNIKFEYQNQKKIIGANSSEEFIWMHSALDMSEGFVCSAKREDIPKLYRCEKTDTYSLIPKTRIVKTVENVTHLVPVEQKRNVTTVRNETGYVNRFFGYRQPFYFGY